MRIVQITPGAGGEFYCENCIRDNAAVGALRALGHDALLLPLYLPFHANAVDVSVGQAVFFGGINVYLQQKSALFRSTPRWLDRLLDWRPLLKLAARRASLTRARDLGAETVSMLQGPRGRQAKELARLIAHFKQHDRPDVICLSNALLAGLAGPLAGALGVPVACLLEGEDQFLDELPEPYRRQALDLLGGCARHVAVFLAVSRYFADLMVAKLRLPPEKVRVVHSGINLEGYAPPDAPPGAPVIGYLSPMSAVRGADILLEAFIRLRREPRFAGARLAAAGGCLRIDRPFVDQLRRRVRQQALEGQVRFLPNLGRAGRQEFLRGLSVLSVPTRRPEPFGLYVLEALASGVPVVGPDHGALPEILQATGGGLLHRPGDAEDLARVLAKVLSDEALARALAQRGRQAVADNFSARHAAGRLAEVFESLPKGRAPPDA